MRIGVEEPVNEDLPGECLEQLVCGLAAFCAFRCVQDRNAVDELEHEQARRRQLWIETRHVQSVIGPKRLPHPLDVRSLLAEIELSAQRVRQVFDKRRDVDRFTELFTLERLFREELEQTEVTQDLPFRPWPLHLDDDMRAVIERCAVHLPD